MNVQLLTDAPETSPRSGLHIVSQRPEGLLTYQSRIMGMGKTMDVRMHFPAVADLTKAGREIANIVDELRSELEALLASDVPETLELTAFQNGSAFLPHGNPKRIFMETALWDTDLGRERADRRRRQLHFMRHEERAATMNLLRNSLKRALEEWTQNPS